MSVGLTVVSSNHVSNPYLHIDANGVAHITGTLNAINTGVVSANTIRIAQGGKVQSSIKKFYGTPKRCYKRKGGPRSKTFCEVFEEVPHTTHMGRSYSGKWYTWEGE